MWTGIRRVWRQAALAAAAALSISSTWAADTGGAATAVDAQQSVWTPKQLHFLFQGFTAHYSCDGLEDKIKRVVRELGARSDFEVHSSGCSSPLGRPDPFPAVNIKINVLEPAPDNAAAADLIGAHWKRVDLHLDRDPVWEAGDCELLEQVRQRILPLFATRSVDFASNCVPHQAYLGTRLSAELLIADPKDVKASAH